MMDERFSAYLDGETSPAETEAVWSELSRDPALRNAWGRQHWLRGVLRDADVSTAYDPDFAARVGRLLDATAPAESVGGAFAAPRRRWRAAASLAMAASIVGVVLLVSEPLGDGGDGAATLVAAANKKTETTAAARETETAASTAEPRPAADTREATTVTESRRTAAHWSVSDPDVEEQLNGYLLEHNGLARSYGMSGATPSFLRVATYGRSGNR